MTAQWIVAKYVPDIRRREPINVGVVLYVDGRVLMRFLGENDRGILNGRRLRGKVETVANYKAWIAHWRETAPGTSPKDLVGKPGRDENYFLEPGGQALRTERSPGEFLRFLFEQLVAAPAPERVTKAEAVLDRLHLDSPGWFADRAPQIMAALRGLRSELAEWQAKCETRSRELETAREEARRAEQARDEMQRELIEAQRDLADMKDAVAAAFGGHA